MDAFHQLRKRAKKKLDAAINLANREYNATLARIADLEGRMAGAQPAAPTVRRTTPYRKRSKGELSLAESMQSVLRTHGALSKLEICVHVLELGYETSMCQRELMAYAGKLLRYRKHLFKREAGKWTLVG